MPANIPELIGSVSWPRLGLKIAFWISALVLIWPVAMAVIAPKSAAPEGLGTTMAVAWLSVLICLAGLNRSR